MTVGELIEYLSTFPPNAEVQIDGKQDISITLQIINNAYYADLSGIKMTWRKEDEELIDEYSS